MWQGNSNWDGWSLASGQFHLTLWPIISIIAHVSHSANNCAVASNLQVSQPGFHIGLKANGGTVFPLSGTPESQISNTSGAQCGLHHSIKKQLNITLLSKVERPVSESPQWKSNTAPLGIRIDQASVLYRIFMSCVRLSSFKVLV